jgi:DNA polymerase-1
LEAKLSRILAKMELAGVKLDLKVLEELEEEAQASLATLKRQAVKLAGGEFNLNSPAQLADILFNRLKLPPQRRNKTGPSTDTDVLEVLAELHPLPKLLLQYRVLAKLSNTYLQALPKLVDPVDQRLHSSWNQAVAATGRLSSSDPNLQNIPIRTDLGRRIRRAFTTEKTGDLILTADYSQVELRILAHYSRDEALLEAFREEKDIHARTAARVFGVAVSKVDEDMRRRAKVINFGILYGMSPFGLSRELDIPQPEARAFIEAYFAGFPKVRAFLESCKQQARDQGFVSTLLGRRRSIPEIHSANKNLREFAERTAVNTPIQGSAADLIKKAMLLVDALLQKKKARSRLILQVHDELVFEMAKEEASWLPGEVQKLMEGSMKLQVPLKVSLGKGRNWFEAGH